MATPVGHSLIGLALGRLATRVVPVPGTAWRWYVLFLLAANAPDLDFIPGLLVGDINRFHQGITHSLVAMLFFGGIFAGFSRWLAAPVWPVTLAGIAAYGSHLLLDLFCQDSRVPVGIPLLWPFSDESFTASWIVFPGVAHGIPGDDMAVVLVEIFSLKNLAAIGIELTIMMPVLMLCWYLSRERWRAGMRGNPGEEVSR